MTLAKHGRTIGPHSGALLFNYPESWLFFSYFTDDWWEDATFPGWRIVEEA